MNDVIDFHKRRAVGRVCKCARLKVMWRRCCKVVLKLLLLLHNFSMAYPYRFCVLMHAIHGLK